MRQSTISIRVDEKLKKSFDELCDGFGLSNTAAFTSNLEQNQSPKTGHILDPETVNFSYDVVCSNIYQENGKLLGVKIIP